MYTCELDSDHPLLKKETTALAPCRLFSTIPFSKYLLSTFLLKHRENQTLNSLLTSNLNCKRVIGQFRQRAPNGKIRTKEQGVVYGEI